MMGSSTNSLATSREQIFQALFDRLKEARFPEQIRGQSSWRGSARKFIDPMQIPLEAQPFLAQFEGMPELYEQPGNRLPAIRTLGARIFGWAQANSGDSGELGTRYVTWMLEAIENALAEDSGGGFGFPGNCTLGNLVQYVKIEGMVLKFPGDTDTQAMVCVPVKILWP
jgi:hypothetical protein